MTAVVVAAAAILTLALATCSTPPGSVTSASIAAGEGFVVVGTIPLQRDVEGGIPVELLPPDLTTATTSSTPPAAIVSTTSRTSSAPSTAPDPPTSPDESLPTCDEVNLDGSGFAPDSWALPRPVADLIPEIVHQFNGVRFTSILVIGHTDRRAGTLGNDELSRRRATSVAEALGQAGIDPSRITTEGRGDTEPADPADNELAWALNRRIQIIARCSGTET